jgi:hypothetical protein
MHGSWSYAWRQQRSRLPVCSQNSKQPRCGGGGREEGHNFHLSNNAGLFLATYWTHFAAPNQRAVIVQEAAEAEDEDGPDAPAFKRMLSTARKKACCLPVVLYAVPA